MKHFKSSLLSWLCSTVMSDQAYFLPLTLQHSSHASSSISAVSLGRTDETQGKSHSPLNKHVLRAFIPLTLAFTPKNVGSGVVSKSDHHPLIFSSALPSLFQIKALTPLLKRLKYTKTKKSGFLQHFSISPFTNFSNLFLFHIPSLFLLF